VCDSTASVLVRAITTNAYDPGQRIDQQLNMFNQRQLAQSEPVAAVAARSLRTTATPGPAAGARPGGRAGQLPDPAGPLHDTVPLTAQRGADAFAKA
jgi:hypothetical protein